MADILTVQCSDSSHISEYESMWKRISDHPIEQAIRDCLNSGAIFMVYKHHLLSVCYPNTDAYKDVLDKVHLPFTATNIQYIPRNMHTVFALLCFVVVIHWLIFPYPSGLLHWHCGNLTIAPVPAKQPWWIWINTSCEFIMNDCITTTKQSTTKPCAYFLGYTVKLYTDTAGLYVYRLLVCCGFVWTYDEILPHLHDWFTLQQLIRASNCNMNHIGWYLNTT